MKVEDALKVVATVLPKRLNDVQVLVFRLTWEGKSFAEIAAEGDYDSAYVRDVGYKLWQMLSLRLGEKVKKSNLQSVIWHHAQILDRLQNLDEFQDAVGYSNGSRESRPNLSRRQNQIVPELTHDRGETSNVLDFKAQPRSHRDWGNAPDTSTFQGRDQELKNFKQWIVGDRGCRLAGVFGIGGIGKTAFTVKLAEQVQDEFEYSIWRSLRHAPPLGEILDDLIRFLSDGQDTYIPATIHGKISLLVTSLLKQRCLIVLDNFESVLQSGETTGHYREGYEGYGELLRLVGEVGHQSCLIITSREQPQEISSQNDRSIVRSHQLHGLQAEAQTIFADGMADSEAGTDLIDYYRGNPLALQVVSRSIQELFNGDIEAFVAQRAVVFNGIRDLLEQQCSRLSPLEIRVMYWLAINREPITLDQLSADMIPIASKSSLLETLSSLGWRSLIEKNASGFTQQPVVMEYITDRLVEQAYSSIVNAEVTFLTSYALVKKQSKEHIREAQMESILQPLVAKLLSDSGNWHKLHDRLSQLLHKLREQNALPGYGSENILSVIKQLKRGGNAVAELPKVTDLTDLHLLHRLLTSNRSGGLLTDRQMIWTNHLGLNSKDNYRDWIEGALAEFQHDLQQQSQMRKCYRAQLHDHQLAEIDIELEAVQIINSVGESIDACLVFINEVKIIDP